MMTEADKPFFVLNLPFDIVDSVGSFYVQGDGLPSESLDENLHADCSTSRMNTNLLLDRLVSNMDKKI